MLNYIHFPQWLKPEIVNIFGFKPGWYGLMYIVGFILAYILFKYQVKKRSLNIEKDLIINWFFWGIIGLLVGARLFATLLFDASGTYWKQPWRIFIPIDERGGCSGLMGMNYYGGVVGAIVAMVIYARIKKIDILEWGDMLVAAVPLSHSFGRLGNFINAELFGRVTTAPWGMIFPAARRLDISKNWVSKIASELNIGAVGDKVNLPRHPTQIYSWFFEGILLWLILWFILKDRKPFKGFIVGIYIVSYGIVRFILDYFRMPLIDEFTIKLVPINNPPELLLTPFNFTLSQIFSFLMIVTGIVTLWLLYKKSKLEHGKLEESPKPTMRKLRKKISKE